jgi:hypothetical protein
MKTINDINLNTWFMNREMDFVPDHFVRSKTAMTPEAREWVLETLTGRFAVMHSYSLVSGSYTVAFEDPKEALFYELKWA